MSTTIKRRKLELSRAMAIANKTRNLKRKWELSNALAAANDMVDESIEHSLPQRLVSSRKNRVALPLAKITNNSNTSSSSTRPTIMHVNNIDKVIVPMKEPKVQHNLNTSNEHMRADVGESVEETVDKASDDTNRLVNEKRGRGLTRGLNTQKYSRKCGAKPKIIIPKGINRPVGEHSSKHATQIGVLIRLEAPMQVEGWAKISDEKKVLFRKLVNKLDYEVEQPHVVCCIWKSFAKQYSTFRSKAHKYYLKMKDEGGVTLARQSIYEKLDKRRDDWLWLCDFWETEKFKKISETQSKNRSKLKHKHKFGTKSRVAHQYEKNLDDIEMYVLEFHNAKNAWSDKEVEANSARMKELQKEQQTLPDDERMSAEEICLTVLGENSLYAKSKGLDPKSRRNVASTSKVSSNQEQLEKELAATQAELASTKAELTLQKITVEAVVKCMEKMTGKSFSDIINISD